MCLFPSVVWPLRNLIRHRTSWKGRRSGFRARKGKQFHYFYRNPAPRGADYIPSALCLDRARNLLRDHYQWTKELKENGDTELVSLLDEAESYDTSKEILARNIQAEEERARMLIQEADEKRHLVSQNREHGAGKAAFRLQRFLTCFSDFLNSYSGIVECVKAADNQFGGLAYGTLAIFLKVAATKQGRDDLLEEEIREITRYFPRLTTWQDIYPSNELDTERRIADVYSDIILFAQEATKYYCYRSWRKLASSSRPKAPIESKIQDIRTNLTEIKSDFEVLMHKRIHELVDNVRRLEFKIDTKTEEEDTRNLARLSNALGLPKNAPSKDEELRDYNNLLRSVFQLQGFPIGRAPPSMTWEILEEDEEFDQWYKRMDPGLLLLSGYNWQGFSHTTLSWLSQAATLLAQRLRSEGEVTASVFCQRTLAMADSSRKSIIHVLGDLIYQLATYRPRFLRSHWVELHSMITCEQWNSEDEGDILEAAECAFTKLLSAFSPEDTVYLVLDRIDQCCHQQSEAGSQVPLALLLLLRVVKAAPCKVKILIVVAPVRSPLQAVANRINVSEYKALEQFCEAKTNWNQDGSFA